MSNDAYINISDINNTKTTRNYTKNKGGCVVVDRGTPIGVSLSNDNAQEILGDKIWNIERYGHPISKVCSNVIKDKQWFVPAINGQSSANMVIFNKEFIVENWDRFQLNLEPKLVENISSAFTLPVLPHVKLEAGNHEIIQSSPSFNFGEPHIKLNQLVKSEFKDTGLEVNKLDSSVALVRENGHGNDLTHITTILPISWLDEFKDAQIATEERSIRDFSLKKSTRTLEPDTAYILTHRLSPEAQVIAVNSQPSSDIQDIVNNRSTHFSCLGLDHTQEALPPNVKLTQFQAGNYITELIEDAISKESTTSQLIPMRYRTQFFAACADPKVIDLIQKVPVSFPVTIKDASKRGLFRRAIQGSWGRDQNERTMFLETDSMLCKQFNIACDKALSLLRNDTPQIIRVTDKEDKVVCIVTGNHEVGHTMKTLSL